MVIWSFLLNHIYLFLFKKCMDLQWLLVGIEFAPRLILSFILSGIVGIEREVSLKPAGLRTHILVGVGSTLFTVLSLNAFPGADSARIAAAIVLGIGFIGAGTIIKTPQRVIGLTTSASLWIISSIGMAVGAGYYLLGVLTTFLAFLILRLGRFEPLPESVT